MPFKAPPLISSTENGDVHLPAFISLSSHLLITLAALSGVKNTQVKPYRNKDYLQQTQRFGNDHLKRDSEKIKEKVKYLQYPKVLVQIQSIQFSTDSHSIQSFLVPLTF